MNCSTSLSSGESSSDGKRDLRLKKTASPTINAIIATVATPAAIGNGEEIDVSVEVSADVVEAVGVEAGAVAVEAVMVTCTGIT